MRIRLTLFLATLTVASCASTSVATFNTPEEATEAIVRAAEAGQDDEAQRIFDSFARSSVQRDKVYGAMFSAAAARYERGEGRGAAHILSFMAEQYPAAVSAREALVYALFVDRASAEVAEESQTEELALAVEDIRGKSGQTSAWVDLAATQVAIDRGDIATARSEFGHFLDAWDGAAIELVPYVEDIDRYLQSH